MTLVTASTRTKILDFSSHRKYATRLVERLSGDDAALASDLRSTASLVEAHSALRSKLLTDLGRLSVYGTGNSSRSAGIPSDDALIARARTLRADRDTAVAVAKAASNIRRLLGKPETSFDLIFDLRDEDVAYTNLFARPDFTTNHAGSGILDLDHISGGKIVKAITQLNASALELAKSKSASSIDEFAEFKQAWVADPSVLEATTSLKDALDSRPVWSFLRFDYSNLAGYSGKIREVSRTAAALEANQNDLNEVMGQWPQLFNSESALAREVNDRFGREDGESDLDFAAFVTSPFLTESRSLHFSQDSLV